MPVKPVPKLESNEATEQVYGDYIGKLGVGEVAKEGNVFCAIAKVDNATVTPNPFKSFKAAEMWVKETIEAD